jgi:hypothetical protein
VTNASASLCGDALAQANVREVVQPASKRFRISENPEKTIQSRSETSFAKGLLFDYASGMVGRTFTTCRIKVMAEPDASRNGQHPVVTCVLCLHGFLWRRTNYCSHHREGQSRKSVHGCAHRAFLSRVIEVAVRLDWHPEPCGNDARSAN